jgi:hypothetical protein
MPAVLAQVDGDVIGAAEHGQHGGRDRIGFDRSPGLTDRGHVIEIDAQTDAVSFHVPDFPQEERVCT